ncbi:MAG: PVC-type heme-binding CxxCH protein [Pirellula sp.]
MCCRKSKVVRALSVFVLLPLASLIGLSGSAFGQIEKATDAPSSQSPSESAGRFQLPDGFRMELVASEPLVREPSGLCWDERGDLFVCELHGYNLEGQYDIEELNKTGELDRVVRRIQADERHKRAAEAETYGTIKRLTDSDGDGRMDRSVIWADRLPPCLGIYPSRGGIIAACQTQILFLADRDGDGQAELRETLFEGFKQGPLERSINCPQLGLDHWIYFGRGAGGGTIRGKYLASPVELPNTDFRIRTDGTSIEPVLGNTATMGFAFTESGDRFVISTGTPGIFVAPIEWRYLARNPNVAAPPLQYSASSDQRVYPTSQPHPWRLRRANDPGFSKLYTDRYGIQESAPNGYFTSACSPIVYQDDALPNLRGQLLACEPAQNMVHRAIIQRDGTRLTLHRDPSELKSEFLTSSDSWFHAIAMSHAPDGSIYIVDFYREIIEDYSAIPRYLQQQYGLMAGSDLGRLWRLTHRDARLAPAADMSHLSADQLASEIGSSHYWRRTTARRLLVERQQRSVASIIARAVNESSDPTTVINALHALDGLGVLGFKEVMSALQHSDTGVRRQALRFSERWLNESAILEKVLSMVSDGEAMVRLQVALTLGESPDQASVAALAKLSREHGNEMWMPIAVLSSVPSRGGDLLSALLESPKELLNAGQVIEPLCTAIANRRDVTELSQSIERIAELEDRKIQAMCLRGIRTSFKSPTSVALSDHAKKAIQSLSKSVDDAVRTQAIPLVSLLSLETAAERQSRVDTAMQQLSDIRLSVDERISAVTALSEEKDEAVTTGLLNALASSTPRVRDSILNSIFSRRERIPLLLNAIESNIFPASWLTSVQRGTLVGDKDPALRQRATLLLETSDGANSELFSLYSSALEGPRDATRGQQVFREKCGNCHQAHGIGYAVGPDLSAEFQRAEETILKDVLTPSDTISAGFVTYTLLTTSGQVINGLLGSETPTSLTIRQAEGKQETVLRKEIEELRAMRVSMMPEDLHKTVSPKDLADILAWMRHPPTSLTLLDENAAIVEALNEGGGTAEFIDSDKQSGQFCLRITPPQRFSSRIPGWSFRIRENPQAGEFRYLRFAWKSSGAKCVMLEVAADGQWPAANKPQRRYHSGDNSSGWQSTQIDLAAPEEWTVVTRDLWRDVGDLTLTGIAPTAMGGPALFDRIEILDRIDR